MDSSNQLSSTQKKEKEKSTAYSTMSERHAKNSRRWKTFAYILSIVSGESCNPTHHLLSRRQRQIKLFL
jgi:hypothetical protein